MRVHLVTIYAYAAGISCAAGQESSTRVTLNAACIDLNQKLAGKVESGQLKGAESALSGAIERKTSEPEGACAWLTLHNRANVIALSGRLAEAEGLAWQSLRILDRLYSPNDAIRFRTLQLLWSMEYQQGKLGRARQTFQKMRTLRLDLPRDRAMFFGAAAAQLQAEGQYKEAEVDYLRAFAAWEQLGRGDTTEAATLLVGLGTVHVRQNRYSDAGRTLDRALAIVDSAKDTIPMDRVNILGVRASPIRPAEEMAGRGGRLWVGDFHSRTRHAIRSGCT